MRVVTAGEDNEIAVFMHQMIPHHGEVASIANAVNMAKILLKHANTIDEDVESMVYDIINTQNAQITTMRGWLKDNGYGTPESVLCEIQSVSESSTAAGEPGATAQDTTTSGAVVGAGLSFTWLAVASAAGILVFHLMK
eukprot:scaffold13724_cov45-Prasinocladus_malaysianus.AAC.1